MFGRAFTEMFGVMLMSKGFWAAIFLLAGVGYLIQNPLVLVSIVAIAVVLFGGIAGLNRWEEQRLPVNGQMVPAKKFQCTRCGLLGKLRVEKRDVYTDRGRVRWPTVVCRSCGFAEHVPGRVI